jgi:hypothetical protein
MRHPRRIERALWIAAQLISSDYRSILLTPRKRATLNQHLRPSCSSGRDIGGSAVPRRDVVKGLGVLAASTSLGGINKAWAADKDTIRIGYISPVTGPFAPFAEADNFTIDSVKKAVSSGLTIGGKQYNVEILARDDQTSSDRASNLAPVIPTADIVAIGGDWRACAVPGPNGVNGPQRSSRAVNLLSRPHCFDPATTIQG